MCRTSTRAVGLRLPVYPVKGYSLTLPILDADQAPVSTLVHESHQVAITRLGNRVRVAGIAQLCGFDGTLPPAHRATLERALTGLFPGACRTEAAEYWCGLRPMSADGTPLVGPSPIENLYLNTGHGTLGWTLACGSAQVLADLVSGKAPAIDPAGLGIDRHAR